MTKLADPVEMVKQGAPRVIRNDAELNEYTDALFELTSKGKPNRAEQDAIEGRADASAGSFEERHLDVVRRIRDAVQVAADFTVGR